MHIVIDGVKVNYIVSGEGRNVILLHGWGQNIQAFEAVHKFLDKKFRVYTIDFPGFGESDQPPVPWGIEEYTVLVEKFVNELQIIDPILVGHSFGGRVSIVYSSRNEVRKVILVDSAGVKPKRSLEYYVKVYTFKTAKHLLRLPIINKYEKEFLNKLRSKFGSSDYKNTTGVLQQTMVKVVNEDLTHLMPKISAPTLLIWGENDTATPVSDGKLMEKLIPDAGLVILKGCGHFSYLEKFNEFAVIVDHFLKKDGAN
ncbi:MAG: alpha/beta hydrolase family protein [Bacillales bacterium]|jgi:pimeloyl-ACP methyl ester carboxylesterase|nr:alpha/beta hydrolase family protein [Bacillales bacterium]